MPLYPLAFSRVDLRGYDLILSNKSGFCHGVSVPDGADAHLLLLDADPLSVAI